jgi:hypothetical protein
VSAAADKPFPQNQPCRRPGSVRASPLAVMRNRLDWLAAWLSVHDQLGSTAGTGLAAWRAKVKGIDRSGPPITTVGPLRIARPQHVARRAGAVRSVTCQRWMKSH